MFDKLKTGKQKIIYPKNLILGEGPIWIPDTKSLIWLDIKGKSLHTFSYVSKNIIDISLTYFLIPKICYSSTDPRIPAFPFKKD